MPGRVRLSQIPGDFQPIREIEDMGRRLEDEIIRPVMRAVLQRIPEEIRGWYPAIEVIEKGNRIEVKIELPGLKDTDVEVSVSDDVITVKGERKPDSGVKDEDYHRSEFSYGSFYRSIPLPSKIEAGKAEASLEDGILRVSLQRAAGAKSRKIDIQVKKETS